MSVKIDSELKVVASEQLTKEVEAELKKNDPTEEEASKAIFNETIKNDRKGSN